MKPHHKCQFSVNYQQNALNVTGPQHQRCGRCIENRGNSLLNPSGVTVGRTEAAEKYYCVTHLSPLWGLLNLCYALSIHLSPLWSYSPPDKDTPMKEKTNKFPKLTPIARLGERPYRVWDEIGSKNGELNSPKTDITV